MDKNQLIARIEDQFMKLYTDGIFSQATIEADINILEDLCSPDRFPIIERFRLALADLTAHNGSKVSHYQMRARRDPGSADGQDEKAPEWLNNLSEIGKQAQVVRDIANWSGSEGFTYEDLIYEIERSNTRLDASAQGPSVSPTVFPTHDQKHHIRAILGNEERLKAFAKLLQTVGIADPRRISEDETQCIYSEEDLLGLFIADSKVCINDVGVKGQRSKIIRAIEEQLRDNLLSIQDLLPRARRIGYIYAATFRTIEASIPSKTITSYYRSDRFDRLIKHR